MNLNYSNIYFLGIGGIGMSALARYFHAQGKNVSGYDRTATKLTHKLIDEGISIHFEDLGDKVLECVGDKSDTLVVATPAVPASMQELLFFQKHDFTIHKRAVVLGEITAKYKTLGVAGTHGKTTTSTMLAYVLSETKHKCNAFLGGISANFDTNLHIDKRSQLMVVEADEYDRSFHQLSPFSTIVTSTDADHLDIYKSKEALEEAFEEYVAKVNPDGCMVAHHSVKINASVPILTYGIDADKQVDYLGVNLRIENGDFKMDVRSPKGEFKDIVLGLPGIHNAENALSVIAICDSINVSIDEIRDALANFKGVKRRFEIVAKTDKIIYIDDYAHHPTAIDSLLKSIKLIYPEKPIHLVFQPHLYSRTQDFMNEFASSLNAADHVYLLPIYPAREEAIKGVTSERLGELISTPNKVFSKEEVLKAIAEVENGVVLTVGAGDIDQLTQAISEIII